MLDLVSQFRQNLSENLIEAQKIEIFVREKTNFAFKSAQNLSQQDVMWLLIPPSPQIVICCCFLAARRSSADFGNDDAARLHGLPRLPFTGFGLSKLSVPFVGEQAGREDGAPSEIQRKIHTSVRKRAGRRGNLNKVGGRSVAERFGAAVVGEDARLGVRRIQLLGEIQEQRRHSS